MPHLSSRFCIKEAFIKAICSDSAIDLKNIEIYGLNFGKKQIKLHGRAKEMFELSNFNKISFSMSHESLFSVGMVCLF